MIFLSVSTFVARSQDEVKITEAKFKTGNDQSWSQPGFDDSKWQSLKTSVVWDEQGYPDYDGYA